MTVLQPPVRTQIRALEAQRAPRAALLGGVGLAASTTLGLTGLRPFRERMLANKESINATLPVHSKWWREHARSEGELLYVAIGDSTAQGIGASRPERSYVGQLAAAVRQQSERSVRVLNLGVSGATTSLAVRDQLPRFRALAEQPALVTVAIGANDIDQWNALTFDNNIHEIFAALPGHAVVAELPCFYFPQNERKVAEANRILRDAAAENKLAIAPLHSATRHQGVRGILTEFARDMFHPNDHGYSVWAAAIWPTLAERLAAVVDAELVPEPVPSASATASASPQMVAKRSPRFELAA